MPASFTQNQQGLWTSVSSSMFDIIGVGIDKLIYDIDKLENNWPKKSVKVVGSIAEEMRGQAQDRSPYLYGILQGAHFDEASEESDGARGLVAIDPNVWHPILGGRPNEYGARIHGEDRPWFAWTIEQEGRRIIQKYDAQLFNIYTEFLTSSPGSGIF